MDLLGVDSEGILTVVELKVMEDPYQLQEALDYYDWILDLGLEWFSDAYKNELKGIQIAEKMPQIFLIASDFNEKMKHEAKYITEDVRIRLFKYKAYLINEKKEIFCFEESIAPIKTIESKPWTENDVINYIKKEDVRELFIKAKKDIETLCGEKAEVKGWGGFAFWYHGTKVAELDPKKEFFNAYFKEDSEEGWGYLKRMSRVEEWEKLYEDKIKKAFDLVKKKKKLD
jgi:hypothetical protein